MFITSGYIENNTWVRGNTRFISPDLPLPKLARIVRVLLCIFEIKYSHA